jgi:hypothetical protein
VFLSLCVACAAPLPTTVYVPVERCSAPVSRLLPTAEPPMRDATNADLLLETDDLRLALRECNRDKADTKRLIENNRGGKPK